MKKRERFIFSMLLLVCLTLPFSVITSFAYVTYGHRYTDGKCSGYFAINANVTYAPCGSTYNSLIRSAVSGWNILELELVFPTRREAIIRFIIL